jgi:hypothetical protein
MSSSPPPLITVSASTKQYTQDVAIIDINTSKINPSSFAGNVIDLGTKFPPEVPTAMMYPNLRNSHSFDYPGDHLLSLWGTIMDDKMCKPTLYDQNSNPCIMVIKHGRTTGLTVSHANNILSYTHNYFSNNYKVSKEWAILPFDNRSSAFTAKGNSSAVIVNDARWIGGLLTGSSGATDFTDVTYVIPISFVLKAIHGDKSLTKAYPKSGPSA